MQLLNCQNENKVEKNGENMSNIHNIIIAGAGIIGSSMAQLFSRYQYEVTLYDISEESIAKSKQLIKLNQNNALTSGEMSKEEVLESRIHISFSTDIQCFKNADFVIEAIAERIDIKQAFFRQICEYVSENTILTSNTSGLSLTEIAKAIKNPERFCGMHWLNPPHICPLVEVISSEKTSDETIDRVYNVALDIQRIPVKLKKEVPGFLVNRFQFAILREAMSLIEDGVAEKEDIDKVFKYGLGLRYACLGPFEIADLGGLDTFYQIASYLFADLSDTKEVHNMLRKLWEEKDYGVKTGKGFYDYSDGKDKKIIEKRDKSFAAVAKVLYGAD